MWVAACAGLHSGMFLGPNGRRVCLACLLAGWMWGVSPQRLGIIGRNVFLSGPGYGALYPCLGLPVVARAH